MPGVVSRPTEQLANRFLSHLSAGGVSGWDEVIDGLRPGHSPLVLPHGVTCVAQICAAELCNVVHQRVLGSVGSLWQNDTIAKAEHSTWQRWAPSSDKWPHWSNSNLRFHSHLLPPPPLPSQIAPEILIEMRWVTKPHFGFEYLSVQSDYIYSC